MIAVSSSGRSFAAIARYLALGRNGNAPERVAWTSARNLPSNDPELASRFMRATAAQSLTVEKPVYHLAIAFDPHDAVDRATMERVADGVLARLGLTEYEAIIVAHRDRAHPHMHLLVNRVHPATGKAWDRWQDRPTIQRVLREEELRLGLREVPGSLFELPNGEHLGVTDYFGTRDRPVDTGHAEPVANRERSAAHSATASSPDRSFIARVQEHLPVLRRASSWEELQTALAAIDVRIERRGQGLVITDGTHIVKASRVARELGMGQLSRRFGISYDAQTRGIDGSVERQFALFAPPASAPSPPPLTPPGSPPLLGAGLVPQPPIERASSTTVSRYKVAELARRLALHERISALATSEYAASRQVQAARARLAQLEALHARREAANELFARGLARVFEDGIAARKAFDNLAEKHGIDAAAHAMRERPHIFGALRVVERPRAFGFGHWQDDGPARRAALTVATQGREAWLARAGGREASDEAAVKDTRERLHRQTEKRRSIQKMLSLEPERRLVERQIVRLMRQLVPREIDHLRRVVTAPHYALALKLRDTVKDIALGREGVHD